MPKTAIRVGPFEIGDRLGAGGMAEVFQARHTVLDQAVALKVVTDGGRNAARFRANFRREVQAAARLNHPSIVRVFDYGVIDADFDERFRAGTPYLVMEIADRGALSQVSVTSFGTYRSLILQILDALAYAHARGIVHRDVKPANLLLASTADGRVRIKLADFGIAHAAERRAPTERDGHAVGTFVYTPPEQLRGDWRSYGPPTDLYALGCSLWRMLTGEHPFTGATDLEIAAAHFEKEPPDFAPVIAVPAGLQAWLRRLLCKDPSDRYRTAADAALAFMSLGADWHTSEPISQEIIADEPTHITGSLLLTQTFPDTVVMPADLSPISHVSSGGLASGAALALQGAELRADAEGPLSRYDATPRLPSTWRRADIDYEAAIAGLGLGLFGLREVPFVGREGERDAVWNALRLVESDRACRVVVLRGPSGAGKSRLAQWLGQRAQEIGAATVLHAVHAAGRTQGLRDLVERTFVAHDFDDPQHLAAHIQERLRDYLPAVDAHFLAGEANALAAIVWPEAFARASQRERLATINRLLRAMGETRPVILWLDDAQWDAESIALAQHLCGQPDLGVLVVATIQSEAAAELPQIEDALAELLEQHNADMLAVRRLDDVEQADLVGRLIGLEPNTCARVAAATRGNPLFAVHLVGDWVERGALVATPLGFVLRDGADTPADMHALWIRRVQHICQTLGGQTQLVALELAAALQGPVREDEWGQTCAAIGVQPAEELASLLIKLGMAVAEPAGFRFVHRMLADSIRAVCRAGGRWQAANIACATALAQVHRDDETVAERCARHYIAADQWARALAPLQRAIHHCLAGGDVAGADDLLVLHAGAAANVQAVDVRLALEGRLLEAKLRRTQGHDVDVSALQTLSDEARAANLDRLVGLAECEVGQILAHDARLHEALQAYARGHDALQAIEDDLALADLLQARAWAYKSLGDTRAAEADLSRALDIHRATGDRLREMNTINSLAFTFLAAGDNDASREIAMLGVELGREVGHRGAEAGCWTTIGEIERFEGNFDAARSCYARAAVLDDMCGSKHGSLVRANAALVEVGAGNWRLALQRLAAVEEEMAGWASGWMIPFFALARSACYAAQDNWVRADEEFALGVDSSRQSSLIELDHGWLAEIFARVAMRAGKTERARAALEYALEQYVGLDDPAEVDRVRAAIASLT